MERCHRRLRRLIGFVLLIGLCWSLSISDSLLWAQQAADADVLVAQAVLAYEEKKYEESLDLLKEALALDPQDPRGLFYKGLIFLAQNRPRLAIDPLEEALELRPGDVYIRYHLGVAYLNSGQYKKAGPLLEEVFAQQPILDNLGYYVALYRYRNGKNEAALGALEQNQSDDRAMAFREEELKRVLLGQDQSGDSFPLPVVSVEPLTQPSTRFRNLLPGGVPFSQGKRLRLQVTLGAFYDDNVAINPDPAEPIPILDPANDPNFSISNARRRETTAPGFLAHLRGDYAFYREGPVEAVATYSFLQTAHGESLSDFDIQDHLGGLSWFYRGLAGDLPYQIAAQYTYDYYFLDMTAFLARHTPSISGTLIGPAFNTPLLGSIGNITTVQYRYQVETFFLELGDDAPQFAGDLRDSFNNMVGFSHAFLLANDRVQIRIGYQYDNESADGVAFSYTGNRLLTGGQVTLPWGYLFLRYNYDVHWRAYKNNQTTLATTDRNGLLTQRYDIQHTHLFQIVKPLPNNFSLALQYQGIRNASKIPLYDYSKDVFLGTVTWTY